MPVFAGQDDARRSMALLWGGGEPGEVRPGPKPGLSVDVIVEAAIEVADTEGMAALSMRRVGERLGRTGMALYTYVPGKAELIDLMYDRALAELPAEYDVGAGWRPAVASWAGHLLRFYLRHPWMLQVSQARPVAGPNEFAVLEGLVAILRGTGLGPRRVRGVVALLFDFVRGAARTCAETGAADGERRRARSLLLEQAAPGFAARFPMVTWAEPAADEPAGETFTLGLHVLLDGVEAAVRET
ncbi:TetR/AcrR family transcriptional regulator [Nonomuraea sp. NPDC004297]